MSAARSRRTPWITPRSIAGWVSLASLAVSSGCGYSFDAGDFGAGIRTVAVQIADNRTFRQGLEVPLTRAVHRALADYSDLRPAASDDADALLHIVIHEARGRALVRDANPVREGSVDFVVEARLVRRVDGALLRERELLDRGEFRVPVGETTQSAIDEAVSDLARKIVLALEGDF